MVHDTSSEADDLADKEVSFHHFVEGLLVVVTHLAQAIAFLTVAFAVGAGWWSGLAAFVAIGLAIGIAFHQHKYYWSVQCVEWVLLAAIGIAISVFAG